MYEDEQRRRYRSERHEGSDSGLLKWILAALSTLTVAAVIGAWNQNAQLAELQAEVRNLKERVDSLTRIVEPRYRGQREDSDVH